jgi:acetolactate decarboxylase
VGYHFHFISKDHQRGGHVLDCRLLNGEASLDEADNLWIIPPRNADFQKTDFSIKE